MSRRRGVLTLVEDAIEIIRKKKRREYNYKVCQISFYFFALLAPLNKKKFLVLVVDVFFLF